MHDGNFSSAVINDGVKFLCTAPIIYPSGTWSDYHIKLKDAGSVNIGDATSTLCEFEDVTEAIVILRTDVVIHHCKISRPHLNSNKTAIYASGLGSEKEDGYNLTVGGANTGEAVDIDQYATGIEVYNNYNVSIELNHLSKLKNGIVVNKCMERTIFIHQNDIHEAEFGICFQDNHNAAIDISDNTINWNRPYNEGTESRKGILGNNSTLSISGLSIVANRIDNCKNGIQIMNQQNGKINENIIRYFVTDANIGMNGVYRNGIVLQEALGIDLGNNQVLRSCSLCTPVQSIERYLRGISIEQSVANVFDNYCQTMGTGIRTYSACKGTTYECNWLDNCFTGFYFDQAALATQGGTGYPTDNRWTNFAMRNRADQLSTNPIHWYYDLSKGADYYPQPFANSALMIHNTTGDGRCSDIIPYEEQQRMISGLISDNNEGIDTPSIDYKDDQNSYRLLKKNASLMNNGTGYDISLQNFYTLTALQNTGILEDSKALYYDNDKANAVLLNNSINATNLKEANSKFVNNLVFAFEGDELTLSNSDKSSLTAIAFQYPLLGGEGVYRARAILKLDVDDSYLEYRKANLHPSNNEVQLTLYPNPASNLLFVNYFITDLSYSIHEIVDLQGQRLSIYELDPKQSNVTIDLSNFATGMYFVRMIDENMVICKRFVVAK